MAMPKGHKSEQGYATVSGDIDGMDYRSIAEEMSASGYQMNHATARNVFLRAMQKLATPVCEMYGCNDPNTIEKTARDPRFQSGMFDLVSGILSESNESEIDI